MCARYMPRPCSCPQCGGWARLEDLTGQLRAGSPLWGPAGVTGVRLVQVGGSPKARVVSWVVYWHNTTVKCLPIFSRKISKRQESNLAFKF